MLKPCVNFCIILVSWPGLSLGGVLVWLIEYNYPENCCGDLNSMFCGMPSGLILMSRLLLRGNNLDDGVRKTISN